MATRTKSTNVGVIEVVNYCLSVDREVFRHSFKCIENGIRIFDLMLFEDTVVSKIIEDFNTKCYVMNNEENFFNKNNPWKLCFY